MNLKQICGKNIRYYRHQKNLTQEQFAEKSNLDVSYVSELENGKYGPTFDRLEEIAKILDVEPYILLKETNNTHKKLPTRVNIK